MRNQYKSVAVRFLNQKERGQRIHEKQTPLVIEPDKENSAVFLKQFLSENSAQIKKDIATHGAVLLRGFKTKSVKDFEKTILSIQGMQGIDEVLWSEDGRDRVKGTNFVLYTNTKYKTGGEKDLPSFHNENYFVPDFPNFISFFCLTPSEYGGETSLTNLAKLYSELPKSLKRKLEAKTCLVSAIDLSQWSKRSGVSQKKLERFCAMIGLAVENKKGKKSALLYKPTVLEHPVTHEKSLTINSAISFAGKNLKFFWADLFFLDYLSFKWRSHLLSWYTQGKPASLKELKRLYKTEKFKSSSQKKHIPRSQPAKFQDLLTDAEIKKILILQRKYFSSFFWKSGDILIIDNIKMAHSGMPGGGAREIRAMICNPIKNIPYSKAAPGLFKADLEPALQTMGNQFSNFKKLKK